MSQSFDAIVIGAGAMGSAAAYYLGKRGQRVLLLEQFQLDHRMGSSYGHSRIIRYSYDFPEYVDLAKDTFPLWFALQEELGEQLYFKTGGIDFGPAEDDGLQATIDSVRASGIEHELLSIDEAQRRFPQFRFADGFKILFQPESGFITASKAVRGHIKLARQQGADMMFETPVKQIKVYGDSVEVVTAADTFTAGRLVVTAGSWAKSLIATDGHKFTAGAITLSTELHGAGGY